MFTFKQIYQAYLDCRQNKRNKIDVLNFEYNQEEMLIDLVEALNNRSYQPTTSACFYINKPKSREIFAADFKDRIVHHLICLRLMPVWEKIFIDKSFACRPQKGTHRAAKTLQSYLRKVTRNGKRKAYYLKMDIHNFFMSINKHILLGQLYKKCSDEELRWLLENVIFHDPTTDYKLQSSKYLQNKLPRQKSLFEVLENCGLPIGNFTSQFFANVYLNAVDQFVKHELKCRYYLRYVDDSILLTEHKNQLFIWQKSIEKFVEDNLLLSINHSVTKIDSVFNGVDFVGFIVRPNYVLCRRRVIGNCKSKLKKFRSQLVTENSTETIWNYDFELLEQLLATMNSYLGHFRHAQTRKVILKLYQDFSFLNEYFYPGLKKITRKYKLPRNIHRLKSQVAHFTKIFKNNLLLFQVGCYYEAYGYSARQLSVGLNYQLNKDRRGLKVVCGFHQRFLEKVCLRLQQQKISYVLFRQTGRYLNNTMERIPYLKVEFKNEKL